MFKQLNSFFRNQNFFSNNIDTKKENSNSFLNDYSEIDDFEDLTIETFEQPMNQKNITNDFNKKEFLNDMAKTIVTTILDSRKDKKNFNLINTSNNSESDKEFKDKSFSIDIDELFLYNDYIKEKNDIQKFIIEFYLIKYQNKKKINQLVEKWKISYKINDDNENDNNFDINYLKNKILVLQKSIISYSRLLPLYQYIKSTNDNSDYSIDFKFYHNNSKKKGEFEFTPSGNVLLKNHTLFSFKLNIEYYSEKEINNIFNETLDDVNHKIKSLSFTKKKLPLKEFQIIKDENNPINNDNNIYINKVKTYPIEDNNKNKDTDSLDTSSSFILNIIDYDKDKNDIINMKNKLENNQNENNIKDNEEKICKRKYSTFSNSNEMTEEYTPRNSDSKNDENKNSPNINIKMTKNKIINNIIKDYSLLKDMIQSYNSNIVFKNKKLITYMEVFQ